MAENTARSTSSSRLVSKKDVNRSAATRVYIAASKKAGKRVPESVQRLAAQNGSQLSGRQQHGPSPS